MVFKPLPLSVCILQNWNMNTLRYSQRAASTSPVVAEHSYCNHTSVTLMKSYGSAFTPSLPLYQVVTEVVDKLAREALLRWTTFSNDTFQGVTFNRQLWVNSLAKPLLWESPIGVIGVVHTTGLVQAARWLYFKVFMFQFSRMHTDSGRCLKTIYTTKLTESLLFYHN